MADEHTIDSILVADCGAVLTKVLLFERVEDSYRLVAQAATLTTNNPPWNDLSIGVFHAVEEIERVVGRQLFGSARIITPYEGMRGVDAFVVTMSAPEPLRVLLAGLVREMSLESARRAVTGTYAQVVGTVMREGSLAAPEEHWARTVRDLHPDVVLLVGGVDGGAARPVIELAEALRLGISMIDQGQRPDVIYAGNARLGGAMKKLFESITNITVVDNVRPTLDQEHLGPAQEALERLYIERRFTRSPGAERLMEWNNAPVQPTALAFGRLIEYLWHVDKSLDRGTLGVDLGAASATVAATFNKRLFFSIRGGEGLVLGPLKWTEEHGLDKITRWLPEEIPDDVVLAVLHNRASYPWTVPQEPRELWIEQAVIREALRNLMSTARPTWDTGRAQLYPDLMPRLDSIVVSGGGIVTMPRPGHILLAVLDGLEPVGITRVLLDQHRAAPALGALASIAPVAAASALSSGTLVSLGTVISPVGKAHPGETILKIHIAYDDGGVLDVEARQGDLEIWPLLPGQSAMLEIKPLRRFDIGLGPGRGGKVRVQGGLVGLVVDARGRPLTLPVSPDDRRELVQRWFWDVGG